MTTAAFVLALASLIIACMSLGWNVATFALTGSRVKVRGGYSYGVGGTALAEYVTVTATNVGRQPITVTSLVMLAPRDFQLLEPRSALPLTLPAQLAPGDEVTFHFDRARVNRTLNEHGLRMENLRPMARLSGNRSVTGRHFK